MTTIATAIRTATSRQQATEVLAGLTRAELVDLAVELGVHHRAGATAAELRHLVLHFGAGRRLAAAAISRPA